MIGVDISTGMLDEAYDKEVYDDLYAGDVVEFLSEIEDDGEGEASGWDLIVSTDVLPYLGELDEKFHHVGRCLDAGGLFAFSSETMPRKISLVHLTRSVQSSALPIRNAMSVSCWMPTAWT